MRVPWRWLPLLAAVVVAVAWRGGYGQDARSIVAVLAGLAALATLAWAPDYAARASRSPLVIALAALAVLSALSAAWTIGSASEAVRDGAAILAIAAVMVAASALRPAWAHAGLLLGVAAGVAVIGLVAAVARSEPLALEICESWRPAGPFEYPPTLGLVCAGALPPALALGTPGRRGAAAGGAAVAWLLAVSVALTANRTAIALAGAALVAAVWLGPRTRALGPLALAVIAAAAASALIVGDDLGDASATRLVIAALPVLPLCLLATGARRGGAGRPRAWVGLVVVAAVAATAGITVADRGSGCQGDASHGRVGIWRASVATALDRPLEGHGSGTFLAASREHQLEERPRPTRFAHNLALEAWVELGILGVALVAAWYAAVAQWLRRALPARDETWMLVPFVAAFPLANLLDWPWHLLGAGVLWAVAAGGIGSALTRSHR